LISLEDKEKSYSALIKIKWLWDCDQLSINQVFFVD